MANEDDRDRFLHAFEASADGRPRWSGRQFVIPLWYGPFHTDLSLFGELDDPLPAADTHAPEAIPAHLVGLEHLWNRFAATCVKRGTQPMYRLTFSADRQHDEGLISWSPVLTPTFDWKDLQSLGG